ncbi:MAG: aspartate/glutamate racemase family protein, partial [Bacteroidia bacterium]|nr:aspartate/glutamate racemase family protein [Bacteroidia bacterium]
LHKFFPDVNVFQEACPMWVPLVENNEFNSPGADYFIKKNIDHLMQQSPLIDTVILGCTHYPLLIEKIKKYLPPQVSVLSQGEIVAHSLGSYLYRHTEMEARCSKNGTREFLTTDDTENFDRHAAIFFGKAVQSKHIAL